MKNIGYHLRSFDYTLKPLKDAKKNGVDWIQIFIRSAVNKKEEINNKLADEIKKYIRTEKISLIGHGILNPAKDYSNDKRELEALVFDMNQLEKIGGLGIVLHAGRRAGEYKNALKNIQKSIKYVLEKTNDIYLIFENTSGIEGDIGSNIEELFDIYDMFKESEKRRIYFCIDSCHLFVSGLDISKEENVKLFFKNFENKIGLEKLLCIHLNDCRHNLGTRVDGHEDLGFGKIREKVSHFIRFCANNNIPMILETPQKNLNYKKQFEFIKNQIF